MNIHTVMQNLREKRAVFHSEHDFKFALAWEIQLQYSEAKIRLEYPHRLVYPHPGERDGFFDIFVDLDGHRYIIELKYMRATIEVKYNGEIFKLKYPDENQNYRDSFYRDILRIEEATRCRSIKCGYAILLTNYQPYWDRYPESNGYKGNKINWNKYPSFSVCEGTIITGHNEWHESANDLRKRGPVVFNGEYPVKWQKYSEIQIQNCISPSYNRSFMYALVSVLA